MLGIFMCRIWAIAREWMASICVEPTSFMIRDHMEVRRKRRYW
jgi:hypothetical protein